MVGKLAGGLAAFAVVGVAAFVLAGRGAPVRTLSLKGSDTMVILAQRWAEAFMEGRPEAVRVQVTGGGSGVGIAALINGTADVAKASRPLKEAERRLLVKSYGLDPVETPVARDGVAFYVNAGNPVRALTVEELRRIYTGELRSWREVGGLDEPILVYSRENSSGTYAYVKEAVLGKADFAPTAQPLPGTAAVVNAVAQSRNAIGYGGAAYLAGVKELEVAAGPGKPASLPTKANVVAGTYPLSRDLFLVTRGPPAGDARVFIDFVLSPEGQALVEQVGYFPLR